MIELATEPPRPERRGGLERRRHDPRAPELVPAIARGSRDPVVRDLVPVLEQLYARRHALRAELRTPIGKLLFPAFPELLARPPRKPRGALEAELAGDFERRRSDGFETVIRVLLTLAACCNWRTMEILDPGGGFLSVHRLAELAELPCYLVAPKDEDDRQRRFRMDTAERALRMLRLARILCFTKQQREQLEDGRFTSTAPALRKLSVHFFTKVGGALTRTFLWRRGELKKWRGRGRQRDDRQRAPGQGADVRVSESLEAVRRLHPAPAIGGAVGAKVAAGKGSTPPDLVDLVQSENPSWAFPDVLREAGRRWAELEPPPGGASAPPELE
jgi:hypothetical protein